MIKVGTQLFPAAGRRLVRRRQIRRAHGSSPPRSPEAIYEIPPSSPVYNVTYVRVYDTEPDAVWYGYTMGYLFGFLAWGTYVYGTGWSYPPYWYNWPDYGYPIYYPRPATWGLGAYYNPVRGIYGRYGYAYGPYRGIAGARTWNPRTGTYARAGAAWGPRGSAGFVAAYNPRTDGAGYVAGGRNVYGSWKSAGVKRGSEWARVTARDDAGGGSTLRWNTSEGQGFLHEGRRGDMYAGRDGKVYRNTGDGWQKFDGGWQDVARPERGELLQRGEGLRGPLAGGTRAAAGAWWQRQARRTRRSWRSRRCGSGALASGWQPAASARAARAAARTGRGTAPPSAPSSGRRRLSARRRNSARQDRPGPRRASRRGRNNRAASQRAASQQRAAV